MKRATLPPEQWARVKELFDRVHVLPKDQRETFFGGLKDEPAVVIEEVRALLTSCDESPLEPNPQGPDKPVVSFSAPARVGKYRIMGQLGEGGMGAVYLAQLDGPGGFQKRVAVKFLLPNFHASPEITRLFELEANLTSMLSHPNIVQVHEFGKEHGFQYLVMDYVPGVAMWDLVEDLKAKSAGLSPALIAFIVGQICQALEYGQNVIDPRTQNRLEVVHRDLTPTNVLISGDGIVKLVDFGIAMGATRSRVTETGFYRGTLEYMAPEVLKGEPATHRSDLYALGLLIEHMLQTTPAGVTTDRLHTMAEKLTQRLPEERYASAAEVRQELLSLIDAEALPLLEKALAELARPLVPTPQTANVAPRPELIGGAEIRDVIGLQPVPAKKAVNSKRPKTAYVRFSFNLFGVTAILAMIVAAGIITLASKIQRGTIQHEKDRAPAFVMQGEAPDCRVAVFSDKHKAPVMMNGKYFIGQTPTHFFIPCGRKAFVSVGNPTYGMNYQIITAQKKLTIVKNELSELSGVEVRVRMFAWTLAWHAIEIGEAISRSAKAAWN